MKDRGPRCYTTKPECACRDCVVEQIGTYAPHLLEPPKDKK